RVLFRSSERGSALAPWADSSSTQKQARLEGLRKIASWSSPLCRCAAATLRPVARKRKCQWEGKTPQHGLLLHGKEVRATCCCDPAASSVCSWRGRNRRLDSVRTLPRFSGTVHSPGLRDCISSQNQHSMDPRHKCSF